MVAQIDVDLQPDIRLLLEDLLIRKKMGELNTPPMALKQYEKYFNDPVGYINNVLHITLTPDQQRVAKLLVDTKKLLVKAGNSVGKTLLSAALSLWFYDCRVPSETITTAPTQKQVEELLWGELRKYAGDRPGLLPSNPKLSGSSADHSIVGYTARDANSFQGRHGKYLLIIFDEAVGIHIAFWVAADGMATFPTNRWLAICNPTDISSAAYQLTQSSNTDWRVETLSALTHPNILEGLSWLEHHKDLQGFVDPFPGATSLPWVNERIEMWCQPISNEDKVETDIEWPPQSNTYYRPGPDFQSRVLGIWPTSSTNNIWSDSLWVAVNPSVDKRLAIPDVPPEIGCDYARFGGDETTFHVRRGNVSLHHESHMGWDSNAVCGFLKVLANRYGHEAGMEGNRVVVKIDNTGDMAGGVLDNAGGYRFKSIKSSHASKDPKKYPNKRSEMWFTVRDAALKDGMDLSRLSKDVKDKLRIQLMSPVWKFDNQGRATVEPKDSTKDRLGRSPDDADAFNLAYSEPPATLEPFSILSGKTINTLPFGDWRRQLQSEPTW